MSDTHVQSLRHLTPTMLISHLSRIPISFNAVFEVSIHQTAIYTDIDTGKLACMLIKRRRVHLIFRRDEAQQDGIQLRGISQQRTFLVEVSSNHPLIQQQSVLCAMPGTLSSKDAVPLISYIVGYDSVMLQEISRAHVLHCRIVLSTTSLSSFHSSRHPVFLHS
jgi:hypothetical protein